MIRIQSCDVPKYLQNGSFFETLDATDKEEFEVPPDCLKADLTITSDYDLNHVLQSVRFWGVYDIPEEILHYIVKNVDESSVNGLLNEFPEFELYFGKIQALKASNADDTVMLAIELSLGASIVKRLHEQMGFALCPAGCFFAASVGDLPSLQYLQKKGVELNIYNIVVTAAKYGGIQCLQYAHEQEWEVPADALLVAARHGQLTCLKYLHEECHLAYTDRTMYYACESGQIVIIRYLHETGCPWDAEVCALLASKNLLSCLVYAHEQGCPWNTRTCSAAAWAGHMRCLEYAHLQGCPWDAITLLGAAMGNNLDCLMYAHQRGCHMHSETAKFALQNGAWRCLWYALLHGGMCTDMFVVLVFTITTSLMLLMKLYYQQHSVKFKDWGMLIGQSLQLLKHAMGLFDNNIMHHLCLTEVVLKRVKAVCSILSCAVFFATLFPLLIYGDK